MRSKRFVGFEQTLIATAFAMVCATSCTVLDCGRSAAPEDVSGEASRDTDRSEDTPGGPPRRGEVAETGEQRSVDGSTPSGDSESRMAHEPPALPEGARQIDAFTDDVPSEARLEVYRVPADGPPLCEEPTDLLLRYYRGERYVDDHRFEAKCAGACTSEERREGEEHVDEVERRIRRGEAFESELDYNFTDCIVLEPSVARQLDGIGRLGLLILEEKLGAHDIEGEAGRLVTVGCGDIHVTDRFENPLARPNYTDFSPLQIQPTGEGPPWRHFEVAMRNPHKITDADKPTRSAVFAGEFETGDFCYLRFRPLDRR